jgi:hypothetical protein
MTAICAKRVMLESYPQIDRGLVGAPRRCSLQNQFNYPTARSGRIMPLQFISGDRDCSFLVGPYPVRERAVFDFERQFLARYRIRPKRRDASLHYRLVLIGSPRCAVVGCKFRKVTTRIQVDKATIASENNDSFRIIAKCRRSASIRAHCFGRNQGPGSDEFFSGLC